MKTLIECLKFFYLLSVENQIRMTFKKRQFSTSKNLVDSLIFSVIFSVENQLIERHQ